MQERPVSTHQKIVNGLDVIRLHDTIKMLRENPELAKFKFRAHNKWIDGTHLQNTIYDFYGASQEMAHKESFTLHGDEPDILIGNDHGPNATESLLAALASCLNATLIYHASAKGIRVDGLELEVEGDIDLRGFLGIDDSVKRGFQNIRVKCKIKADASDEQIDELCKMAQKYSPVFDGVTHETPVQVTSERLLDSDVEGGKQAI